MALAAWGWALYRDKITAVAELLPRDNANESAYLMATFGSRPQEGCGDTKLLDLRLPSEVAAAKRQDPRADFGQAFGYDEANGWIVWTRDPDKWYDESRRCEQDHQLCYRVNSGTRSRVDGPDVSPKRWPNVLQMALTRCVKGDVNERWEFVESRLKPGKLKEYFKGME
jgi:hypothetical protein